MDNETLYDAAIIGGGLAGLALSIQLSKKGYRVILFEKEQYPFHKVCGEYISMESWGFIESLGLPLSSFHLPIIKKLIVTSPNGNELKTDLPLGGFGISRYFLDNELKKIAEANNVRVHEKCKADIVFFENNLFHLHTTEGDFTAKVCCGSYGKRSNLDIKWKRNFITSRNSKLNNYIGVKYHIKTDFPADSIALHNFEHGYCGVSKIEGDRYCLCYLTNAYNLSRNNNSIAELEKNILYQNKHLKKLFTSSEKLFDAPVTISQISFSAKEQVYNHMLMMGDAAGMITPLCGNGMSMALHSSKIAAAHIDDFLQNKISRKELERNYKANWQKVFSRRVKEGMRIQTFFGKKWLTNLFVSAMKLMPAVTKKIISHTHGQPF
jgi:flavin-dependent dehydrogenase